MTLRRTALMTGGSATILGLIFLFVQLVFADSTSNLAPNSDGTYTQFTPSTGASHFALVDETTCNGTTDYNSTSVVSNKDSYGVSLSSVPNGATITAIAIGPCASRNSGAGGSAVMDVFYRFNGTDSSVAGAYALTGTTPVALSTTTFSSLSFLKSSTSTLEIGSVYTSGNRGVRLSRMYTVLTYTKLTPPTNLIPTNISGTQNDLRWTDNSSTETAFALERSTNTLSGPWGQIATTSANATTSSDTTVSADQTYYYRVRAANSGGYSTYATSTFVITATVVPNAPLYLTAISSSSTSTLLTWTDNSTNENTFWIERSLDDLNYAEVGSTTLNKISFQDKNLASSTTYYYRVRALNAIGYSDYSTTTSITLP